MQGIEDLTSLPDIFMDTSYAVAMHFNLFTSQVSDLIFFITISLFIYLYEDLNHV